MKSGAQADGGPVPSEVRTSEKAEVADGFLRADQGLAASGTWGLSLCALSSIGGGGGGSSWLVDMASPAAGRHFTPKNPSSQVSSWLHTPRQGRASHKPVFSLHRSPC